MPGYLPVVVKMRFVQVAGVTFGSRLCIPDKVLVPDKVYKYLSVLNGVFGTVAGGSTGVVTGGFTSGVTVPLLLHLTMVKKVNAANKHTTGKYFFFIRSAINNLKTFNLFKTLFYSLL
jgi:hypothetical protein